MTIAAVGQLGTKVTTSGGTSWTMTGVSASVDQEVFLIVGVDNYGTTTGYSHDIASVVDSTGANTWSLINVGGNNSVYLYSPTSTQNDGAALAIYKSKIASAISSGSITVTLNNSKVGKCMTGYKFSVASGKTLRYVGGSIVAKTKSVTGSGSLDAHTISGLTSGQYLFFGAAAVEIYYYSTATYTATTGFTKIDTASADSGPSPYDDMAAAGEFKIATATGATAQPTISGDGFDAASMFFAMKEVPIVQSNMMLGVSL